MFEYIYPAAVEDRGLNELVLHLQRSNEGKFPQHSILFLVKNISAVRHMPVSEKLPPAWGQFIEKRSRDAAFDGVEKRSIGSIELLISAASRAGVKNSVSCFTVQIRIARIDPSKVRKQ
jgi:hypothetical protein